MRAFLFSGFLILIFYIPSLSQSAYIIIDQVILSGHKITKEDIIYRELDLHPGDTLFLDQINTRLKENEKRILNTGLFNYVTINIKEWIEMSKLASIEVLLQENWYIYPAPIFELADRNFNVWWNEQNRSFSRVNYGARISHINFTGRKDKLKLVGQFGYTRKYELEYTYPYLNENQSLGYQGNVFYSDNKEIGYKTLHNKTQFHKEQDERILLRRFRASSRFFYRPDLYNFHAMKIEFHRNTINDIIAQDYNSDYFLNGNSLLRFFKLEYDYFYDRRVFSLYPESGYLMGANIIKEGLGIFKEHNKLSLAFRVEKYLELSKRISLASKLKAKTNLIKDKIAFANNTAIGYGEDIVGGYELYVLDGSDFVLLNTSVRLGLLNSLIKLGNTMPLEQFSLMSIKVYLTFNFDSAYVNEREYIKTNTLNNQWIIGFGPGLDIILFNNYLFQIEYSFNELGEKGIYFHHKVSF